ncbi:heme peroxidase [Mycena albidolilacea]|uniref:Peroxidase n=1 Tax=Mycena albidolilacea TaxID=1033008 RepID=A0AAD6Z9E9_9AGAR|nr:heme peroxidase [Mycena albidolilacea]
MLTLALLPWIAFATPAAAWIWPSPQLDALDAMLFDSSGIALFIQPCDSFFSVTNNRGDRTSRTGYVRKAYHDMATHDVTSGTGGLDASIRLLEEQARSENAGDGFTNTLGALLFQSNRYVSIADLLAAATIIAIENCGGPEINFRGGRVDAGEPNLPGVPEPQQDLDSHIAAFSRQRFTQTEMTGLVACGYTLFGGVQHAPFPDIVPELNDPSDTESVVHSDSTPVHFDNNVATEYIAGTTQNPLVVGLNDTTNSDGRIFGSDNNILRLAGALRGDVCARMLNTVPAGVHLTDVITPLSVKPVLRLILDGNTIQFSGEVRFWDLPEDPDRTVRLLWDDHVGGTHNVTLQLSRVVSSAGGRHTATWYSIVPLGSAFLALDAAAGITAMRFALDGRLEDQDGVGFTAQDDLMFSASSCSNNINGQVSGRVDVAVCGVPLCDVRDGLNPTRVYLEQEVRDSVDRTTIVELDLTPLVQTDAAAGYSIWSVDLTGFEEFSIGAEIDGEKVTRGPPTSLFGFSSCPKLL